MKYFKIRIGYGTGDDTFVSIDETELETAVYAFMTDQKTVFKNGVARGKDIISITEDWHKAMGWNSGYKMGPEDWDDVNRQLPEYRGVISAVRDKIQYLIQAGRQELIGKNIEVPELKKVISLPESSMLGEGMKIS